jgi:erythromycin esterase-like protein
MLPASCEDAVVAVLSDLRSRAGHPRSGPVPGVAEDEFDALQNAEVVAGAERYYRTMVRGDAESWNVRDCHMVDTLDRLVGHHGPGSRAVVWEHNTHIGDARATDMASAGMVNVGQVVRDRHADEGVVLVGLGGYSGSVIAAPAWGDTMRQMRVPPARDSSHEALMHEAVRRPALFVFDEGAEGSWLTRPRGHRAIGVVYDPERDPMRNWVPTVLGDRYDAFMFFPETEALHPLRVEAPAAMTEPETYPFSV